MKEIFSKIGKKTKDAATSTGRTMSKVGSKVTKSTKTIATTLLDQDGDGKLDQEDLKRLTEKGMALTKDAAGKAGTMLKEASKSSMAKDAAAGAAVGAAVAVPVPLVGPAMGAVIGSGLGVYKNLSGKGTPNHDVNQDAKATDSYAELLKLGDLKDKGLITAEEFEALKAKVLNN